MMQLVECVPNFSEGRDPRVIRSIADAISHVEGVRLLHVDSNADANRTVMTFVEEAESAGEAAFQAVSRAVELIDMRRHRGAHPRLGAADVCPFVPLAGVSMEKCVRLARRVGERIGRELSIPVYLYGAAAGPVRRSLADIRRGEYESLSEKLAAPEWKPDFGPTEFNPGAGASAVGARDILIALNVNLNTTDQSQASEIALAVREKGRVKCDAEGRIIRDNEDRPGALKACRALGWFMPGYGCAQVSMNLEDFRVTPPHVAFEGVVRQARQRGLEVTGTELVGMIPLEAMLMAGRYYLERDSHSPSGPGEAFPASRPAEELVETAVRAMRLSAVRSFGKAQDRPFRPEERIIEYRLRQEGGRWAEWADRQAARHAVPAVTEAVESEPS